MSSIASPISDAHKATKKNRLRFVVLIARDIKISHTVFAMPFALLSTFLAAKQKWNGLPKWGQLGLILICMVAARTVAMAANRLLDAELDAKNPRTARRAIPSGALSRTFVTATLSALRPSRSSLRLRCSA